MTVRRILLWCVAMLAAYAVGRAAGILLGIGPYVAQVFAIAAVIAVGVGMRGRRPAVGREG